MVSLGGGWTLRGRGLEAKTPSTDVAGLYKDHSRGNLGLTAVSPDTGPSRFANPTAEVGTDLAAGRGLWTLRGGRWTGVTKSTAYTFRAMRDGFVFMLLRAGSGCVDVTFRPKRGCNVSLTRVRPV